MLHLGGKAARPTARASLEFRDQIPQRRARRARSCPESCRFLLRSSAPVFIHGFFLECRLRSITFLDLGTRCMQVFSSLVPHYAGPCRSLRVSICLARALASSPEIPLKCNQTTLRSPKDPDIPMPRDNLKLLLSYKHSRYNNRFIRPPPLTLISLHALTPQS